MKVLVTGGTSALGRLLTRAVMREGHSVRVMSQRPRTASDATDTAWAQADLASGVGLRQAVEGVETIFHLASDFHRPEAVDVNGTRRLVEAARKVGVRHFVYVSIVGIDEIPTRYYKRKREAEQIVEMSGLPHTIQRATQFHSFVEDLLSKTARIPLVMPLPAKFKFQSVDVSEVAARLAGCLVEGARGRLIDFGGPEVLSLDEMAEAWMKVNGMRKKILRVPVPGAAAQALRAGKNTAPDGARGIMRWREWLEARARQHAAVESARAPEPFDPFPSGNSR